MIHLRIPRPGGDVTFIVLDTPTLEALRRSHHHAVSPGERCIVSWTPDIDWLDDQLTALGRSDPVGIGRLIIASQDRPETPSRRTHPPLPPETPAG